MNFDCLEFQLIFYLSNCQAELGLVHLVSLFALFCNFYAIEFCFLMLYSLTSTILRFLCLSRMLLANHVYPNNLNLKSKNFSLIIFLNLGLKNLFHFHLEFSEFSLFSQIFKINNTNLIFEFTRLTQDHYYTCFQIMSYFFR